MSYKDMLLMLWLFVVITHFSESLIYPFGRRPTDTFIPLTQAKEQPLTVPLLIEISQMTNLSVNKNFTLCFNFSNKMELKMFHELKNEEKTMSHEMGKILSIDIKNIFWIESENMTCMVVENASFVKLEHAPILTTNDIVRVVTLSTISAVSLVGNLAVLTTIALNRRRKQSSIYLLIGMLAVADLLVTTSCVVVDAIWAYTVQWLADDVTCKLVKFFQMFSLYFSTFLLVVIGYDRFYAVKFPMKRVDSRRMIRRMLIIIVLLSALFSSPQVSAFFIHVY